VNSQENRSAFLQTVRSALGCRPDRRRAATAALFPNRPPAHSREAAAEPIRLEVFAAESPAAARDYIAAAAAGSEPEWGGAKQVCAWRHPLVDGLKLREALKQRGIELRCADTLEPDGEPAGQRRAFAEDVWHSFIGITSADYCVADTATLVLRTRPGQPRSVSLVPSIHMAVITADRIVADLKELYALLRWRDMPKGADPTNCLTFISGPSKTADIEATLVHGAHGPRQVHLIVLPS